MDPVAEHLEKLKAYVADADRRVPAEVGPQVFRPAPIPDLSPSSRACLARLAVIPRAFAVRAAEILDDRRMAAKLTDLADAVHWRVRIRTYRMLTDRTQGAVLEELERQISPFPGRRPGNRSGTGGNGPGTAREPPLEPTFREAAEEAQRRAQERGPRP